MSVAAASLILMGCSEAPDAETIIDAAITAHGGLRYQSSVIEFDFRGTHYTVSRHGGPFTYARSREDSTGTVKDMLSNSGFYREIDGVRTTLSARDSRRFSNSLNSVVYFALLPFALNDAAVQKRYLGEDSIAGEKYYEIEVSFNPEGGGEDYKDTFVYWIHQETHTMDYLAYLFHRGGGGTRFRQAFNQRTVNGIRFADYHNFKGSQQDTVLSDFHRLFEDGELTKVSEIMLDNVRVESSSN